MAEVTVYGTAAADVVVRVPRLPGPGDHLTATPLGWRLGGGSVNVACGLAAAGHRVELCGPIGDDAMAQLLVEAIAARGVGTSATRRVAAPSPRALILLDERGERTILGIDAELAAVAFPFEPGPTAPVDGIYVESYHRFPVGIAAAAGAALVVAPPPATPEPWPADVIVGSEAQFPVGTGEDPHRALRRSAGDRLRWVVVTRGAGGADAYGDGRHLHVDAPAVQQVDATGAGDAFTAALLSSLVLGVEVEAALAGAVAAGAAAVETLESVPVAAIEALGASWPGRA